MKGRHMKKTLLFILIFMSMIFFTVEARGIYGRGEMVPEVNYMAPKDESKIDLAGEKTLTFRWRRVPFPSGGRKCYKFIIFKGFSYESYFKKILEHNVTSIDVPVGIFEDGQVYSWQVKQQDDWSAAWSRNVWWSFKIIKH